MAKCSDTRQARWKGWLALAAVAALASAPGTAGAQQARAGGAGPSLGVVTAGGAGANPGVVTAGGPFPVTDVIEVVPAGCNTCAGGLLGAPPAGPSLAPVPGIGCPTGACYPGRRPCDCCGAETKFGRLLGGLYECICCPDPCYEPRWVPAANAALFVDPVRPATQMRIRGDFAWDMRYPDKGEWFWAQINGKGPASPGGAGGPGERRLDYREGYLYTEAAVDRFGAFVELSYRNTSPDLFPDASGFGDMNIGTKSLLVDCDLLQLTFQFRTFLPTGNFGRGLGTGHVSLEPSFIWALKLTPSTYFQGQLAYWFPVSGSSGIEGNVFHYHLSLNHVLCQCGEDIQLIGTAEVSGYEITNGGYTDVTGAVFPARQVGSILNAGPGLRLSLCNKIDFGIGTSFALTSDRMAGQFLRGEFRWRF